MPSAIWRPSQPTQSRPPTGRSRPCSWSYWSCTCARAGCSEDAEGPMKRLSTLQVLAISAVVVAITAILPFFVSGYILGLLTVAFYFGVFAMAWDLLFGFAGEVNFGPTFLIGVS